MASTLQALYENGRLEVVGTAHTCAGVRSLVKSVVAGLRAWQEPEPSSEGLGGTYFFKDEIGSMAAIVKPCDEEPLAPNNPKVGPYITAVSASLLRCRSDLRLLAD